MAFRSFIPICAGPCRNRSAMDAKFRSNRRKTFLQPFFLAAGNMHSDGGKAPHVVFERHCHHLLFCLHFAGFSQSHRHLLFCPSAKISPCPDRAQRLPNFHPFLHDKSLCSFVGNHLSGALCRSLAAGCTVLSPDCCRDCPARHSSCPWNWNDTDSMGSDFFLNREPLLCSGAFAPLSVYHHCPKLSGTQNCRRLHRPASACQFGLHLCRALFV